MIFLFYAWLVRSIISSWRLDRGKVTKLEITNSNIGRNDSVFGKRVKWEKGEK
jgi:hypothetical protein